MRRSRSRLAGLTTPAILGQHFAAMPPPTDLTLYRFKRQVALAQARGEPIEPLIRGLVVETIEQVREGLEREPS